VFVCVDYYLFLWWLMVMNVGNVFTNLIYIFKSDLVRVIGHGHLFGVRNGSYDCEKTK